MALRGARGVQTVFAALLAVGVIAFGASVKAQSAPQVKSVPQTKSAEPGAPPKPRSVIPWLDQAVDDAVRESQDRTAIINGNVGTGLDLSTPLPDGSTAFALEPPTNEGPANAGGPVVVEVASFDAVKGVSAGTLTADEVGLPVDAWRGTNSADAAVLIDALDPGMVHSANLLTIELLSAAFEPPAQSATGFGAARDLLIARIEALMRFGAHERAVALARSAGPQYALSARDAALITGADRDFCDAVLVSAKALPLDRIYCLVAAGDLSSALLAIEASRAVGGDDFAALALLEASADPAVADLASPPTSARDITPMRLAAIRLLGAALPTDFSRVAPMTMVPGAARLDSPPRQRLEALERLEATGGVSTVGLRAAFESIRAAESGGVWGRVEAYRAATRAPFGEFAQAARVAFARAAEARRLDVMLRMLAPEIERRAFGVGGAAVEPALDEPIFARALWLGGRWASAERLGEQTVEGRALGAIANASPGVTPTVFVSHRREVLIESDPWRPQESDALVARAARGDERASSVLAGLLALGVPTNDPQFYAAAPDLAFSLAEGRSAEIAFSAVASLSGDSPLTGPGVFAALSNLVAVGLTDHAKRIAIEAALAP